MSNIHVKELTDVETADWTSYTRRSPVATIAHRLEFADIIRRSLGHRPRYLIAYDIADVVGILPLFIVTTLWRKKYVVSVPWLDYGGVCADNSQAERALLADAKKITEDEDAEFLEFRSADSSDLGLELRLDKVSFIMDLPPDPDVLWNSFDAKLRNQIRKSAKSGLKTYIGGIERLDEFYRVFSVNMRDLGTPVWGKNLFEDILNSLAGDSEIILVERDGNIIAGGLILTHGDSQYVPSASALRSELKYCPNHALYWAVIERACRTGIKRFDFGRSSWDSGTFRFKKQWGALPKQLEWQYFLNRTKEVPIISPDNPKYDIFVRIWKKLPVALANMLGPRLIRNFP
jgi:FemAB-related protein (PEP-CTERM system-associated)